MTCTECGKPVEICFFCNNLRKVHTRTEEGKAVCSSCHGKMRLKNKAVHEVCSLCGNKKPVKIRGPKGEPICKICYGKDISNHEHCFICGNKKLVWKRTGGKPFCENCSRNLASEICSLCKRGPKPVAVRTESGGAVCYTCYRFIQYHKEKETKVS